MAEEMGKKLSELTGKIKALNFTIKKSDEVFNSNKSENLTRQICSITNRVQALHALKDEIEETIQEWAQEIESKISVEDNKVSEIRQRLNEIEERARAETEETERVAAETERRKQLHRIRETKVRKWKDINPVEENVSNKKQRKSGFYYAKDADRRKRGCVYCEAENHNSKDCPTVTDVNQRKKLLAEKKLCFNCTGAKHRAAECKSVHKCSKCNMKHHSSICTTKDQLLTANGSNDGPIVYPVVVVDIEGIKCRALLDTGAGNSYASAALLDLLPKRSRKKEVRRVEMMLGSVTREMEQSTVRVKATNGEFAMDVNVTKVDKGELLFVDNPNYAKLVKSYQHLEGVEMEDKDQKQKLYRWI